MTTELKRMFQRRGTAAEWTSANPVLADGEIGHETDTKQFKIGDGAAAWNSIATYFKQVLSSDDIANDSGLTGADITAALDGIGSDDIANESALTGADITAALDGIGSDDIANESALAGADISAALDGIGSNDVENESGVTGVTVSAALDTLGASSGAIIQSASLTADVDTASDTFVAVPEMSGVISLVSGNVYSFNAIFLVGGDASGIEIEINHLSSITNLTWLWSPLTTNTTPIIDFANGSDTLITIPSADLGSNINTCVKVWGALKSGSTEDLDINFRRETASGTASFQLGSIITLQTL